MTPEEHDNKFRSAIGQLLGEDFKYEAKIALLQQIKKYVDSAEDALKNEAKREGKCPHENTVNKTTFMDPEDVRREVCLDCRKELIYKGGILQNANDED